MPKKEIHISRSLLMLPPSIVWIRKKQPGNNKVTWEGIERLFIN